MYIQVRCYSFALDGLAVPTITSVVHACMCVCVCVHVCMCVCMYGVCACVYVDNMCVHGET